MKNFEAALLSYIIISLVDLTVMFTGLFKLDPYCTCCSAHCIVFQNAYITGFKPSTTVGILSRLTRISLYVIICLLSPITSSQK